MASHRRCNHSKPIIVWAHRQWTQAHRRCHNMPNTDVSRASMTLKSFQRHLFRSRMHLITQIQKWNHPMWLCVCVCVSFSIPRACVSWGGENWGIWKVKTPFDFCYIVLLSHWVKTDYTVLSSAFLFRLKFDFVYFSIVSVIPQQIPLLSKASFSWFKT